MSRRPKAGRPAAPLPIAALQQQLIGLLGLELAHEVAHCLPPFTEKSRGIAEQRLARYLALVPPRQFYVDAFAHKPRDARRRELVECVERVKALLAKTGVRAPATTADKLIAAALGISVGTLRQRVQRARRSRKTC